MNTKQKNRMIVESAVMLALSYVLSYVKLWQMPLGGSVTLASMLPIMLIAVKYGWKAGVPTAFLYALLQLYADMGTSVFEYCETFGVAVICILFDYVIPFTVLGFAGMFAKKRNGEFSEVGAFIGMFVCVFLRFLCHFFSGVTIWRQIDTSNADAVIYSIVYNGSFLLPDFLISCLVALPIFSVNAIRKELCIR